MSIQLKIFYNPYQLETSVSVNGQDIAQKSSGYEAMAEYLKQHIPLQSWIDPIPFQNWGGLLKAVIGSTNETQVNVFFTGREIDFEDLKESLISQKDTIAYNIKVCFEKPDIIYEDEKIMQKVQEAYNRIESPQFKEILEEKVFNLAPDCELRAAYAKLPEEYRKAMDTEFRIVFSGMYSSGKSTLINAILGKDILPYRTDPCTSRVFEIRHDAEVKFARMECVDKDNKVVVPAREYDQESLKAKLGEIFPYSQDSGKILLPNPPTIEKALIYTDLSKLYPQTMENGMKLVLIDTPGTNEGGNGEERRKVTEKILESDKKEIIIFVTKADNNYDKSILEFLNMVDCHNIDEGAYNQRFFFVLNHADEVKIDEGSSWERKLAGIQDFYCHAQVEAKNRDILVPRFFPMCALSAILVRSGNLSDERISTLLEHYYPYNRFTNQISPNKNKKNYHFDEYCSTSQSIKDRIAVQIKNLPLKNISEVDQQILEMELHSGVPSLEMAIREYVERYAVPLKIKALLSTYQVIFTEVKGLVQKVSEEIDNAERARQGKEEAENDKKEKEEQKEKEKKTIEQIKVKIKDYKKSLENIANKNHAELNIKKSEVFGPMYQAVREAKDYAKQHPEDACIREKTINKMEFAKDECDRKLKEISKENFVLAKGIGEKVHDLLQHIEEIAHLGDNISPTDSVPYNTLKTRLISEVKDAEKKIVNPEIKRANIIVRPFKVVEKVLKGKYKVKVVDYEDFCNKIDQVTSDYNNLLVKSLIDCDSKVFDMVEKIKKLIDDMGNIIEKKQQEIDELGAEIEKIARDKDGFATCKKTFENYRKYLEAIAREAFM